MPNSEMPKQSKERKISCKGGCGLKTSKDSLIEYNNKRYCESCLKSIQENDRYKSILHDYIKYCFGVQRISTWHLTQIKKAVEDGYTYKELYYGLKYSKEYLDIEFTPEYGLGYAINNVDNGIEFYDSLEAREKYIQNNWTSNDIVKPIIIEVDNIDNGQDYASSKMIDLEDLFDE